MIVEGKISQKNEILIDGCIYKNENKFQTSFIIDTGFTGADIAIPLYIAEKLSLSPSNSEEYITPVGPKTLRKGNDAFLRLGDKSYEISYIIHYSKFPLISIDFLKNISDEILIDFVNNSILIFLK